MPSKEKKEGQLSWDELTKSEYAKCLASPVYFMKTYVKIKHPLKGTILFKLYPFQEETLKAFQDYRNTIILKSRQMGISTLVAAYALWLMVFYKDKNILVISLRQDEAKDLVSKIRDAFKGLPSWFKVKCIEDNRLSLKFTNGSQVKAATTTKTSGTSLALSLLICDEIAKIDDAEELWTSAAPTLSTGGSAILLSTPLGVGNFFHKMWQGAEDNSDGKIGKNGFHPIRLPWRLHPDRDDEWRRIEGEKQGNPKKAAQEFDTDFLSSGDTVIDLTIIDFYKKHKLKDPLEIRGIDKGLWIWEYSDYSHTYVVAADVARGDGGDFSAAHVLDITTENPTQVAEYKGNLGTKDFGNFLVALATEYSNALLVVERETYGWSVLTQIIERGYNNTFYSSADLKYLDVQRQLTNKWDADDKKLVPGFSTNLKTRPLIIDNLEHYFRQMAIEIYSRRTLAELETFIWKNGKPMAMDHYNDDLTISLAIALWVRDTALRLRQEGMDLTRAAMSGITMKKTNEEPVYKTKAIQRGAETWKMNVGRTGWGKQNTEDLEWLIR